MGRRKIEIQPITNERNRSVTFLKRKNGLFKKAHELGVLCSVDVAVIIFDERHGHDTKLFQYCSTDIRDVVQRHLRHNGERDTRGPADFSDVPGGAKNDNAGDADDDDDDVNGDDVLPPIKKESAGKNKDDEEFKPSARVITEPGSKNRAPIPYERPVSDRPRPGMTLPTFPPIPQYDHQHPVSSDRLYPLHHQRPYQDQPQNKKPRLDYPLNLNTTHIPRHGDHGHPLSATSSDGHGLGDDPVYMYHPSQSQQFRQTHRIPSEPNNSHPHHHHHHPQHHSQYHQYHAPYPPSPPPSHHGHSQSYDQSSFGPPQSDFPLGPQISSWGRSHGSNGPGSASNPPSGLSFFSSSGTIGPGGYDGISETPFSRGDDGRDNNINNNNGSSDKTTRDTFASAFLEAEQQRKVTLPQSGLSLPRPTTSAASFGLDWPTHVRPPPPPVPPQQQQAAAAPPPPPAPPTAAPPPSDAAASKSDAAGEDAGTTAVATAAADANLGWLDLLSAGTPGTTVPPSSESGTAPSPRSGSADTLASGGGT